MKCKDAPLFEKIAIRHSLFTFVYLIISFINLLSINLPFNLVYCFFFNLTEILFKCPFYILLVFCETISFAVYSSSCLTSL